jgi:hypothetical protein
MRNLETLPREPLNLIHPTSNTMQIGGGLIMILFTKPGTTGI